jgi:CDP-glucose 4,6-dehydratase
MEKVVKELFSFYKNKKVLITGHTGFKGSWLSMLLKNFGADVIGYSIDIPTKPSLYELAKIDDIVTTKFGDVRNYSLLKAFMDQHKPEIVFHLAAQPLVLESYTKPLYTYETNVIGTLNILEAVRTSNYVKSFINVTTDKVYKNKEWVWGYREEDELDGFDPYSNSKSCSELITKTYKRALIKDKISISTVRAGNVIGGGDFSSNRIIPDSMRALLKNDVIEIRNPNSIRPYQHVLEPLFAYVKLAYFQYFDLNFCDQYNIGPNDDDCVSTEKLVELFCNNAYKDVKFSVISYDGPHEAGFLKLDISKARKKINFEPKWDIEQAIIKTIEWIKIYEKSKTEIPKIMSKQINDYLEY